MDMNNGLALVSPRIIPVLHPDFRPAVLANRAFRQKVSATSAGVAVRIALEQADGNVSHFETMLLPESHPDAAGNFFYIERIVKFLLWSRGGFRIHFAGPAVLANRLAAHFSETPTGKFDSTIVGQGMFDHPIEVFHASELPPERDSATALGRHLEGCRIG